MCSWIPVISSTQDGGKGTATPARCRVWEPEHVRPVKNWMPVKMWASLVKPLAESSYKLVSIIPRRKQDIKWCLQRQKNYQSVPISQYQSVSTKPQGLIAWSLLSYPLPNPFIHPHPLLVLRRGPLYCVACVEDWTPNLTQARQLNSILLIRFLCDWDYL